MIPESYRHSGQAPVSGLIVAIVGTVLSSLLLGVVYAFLVSWIPIVQLSLLATAALGAAVGGVAGLCARWGKIRNVSVIVVIAMMGASLGLWMAWVFDAKARFGISDAPLLLSPVFLLDYMRQFHAEGFWSMGKGGAPVTGVFLLIVWAVETFAVLALSFTVSKKIIGSLPFCETCEQWTGRTEGFCRFVLPDNPEKKSGLLQELQQGDLSPLRELQFCIGDQNDSLKVDVCRCGSCDDASYVTASSVEVATNKKGETTVNLRPFVTNGKLSPEEMHSLQNLRDRMQNVSQISDGSLSAS